jgi:subtilisin family serine protease
LISRDDLARELIITAGDGKPGTFAVVLKRLASYGAEQVTEWTLGQPPSRRLVRVYRLSDVPPPDVIASLNSPGIKVERNFALRRSATPNDPLYAEQWALARMSVEAAWACIDTTALPPPVTVAVIDSGIARAHPDLVARVHPASMRFIDAVPDNQVEDEDGHGTYLGGTIAAVTHNAAGVASAPGPLSVNVLALKFYDPWTPLTGANAARAIAYAVDQGAQVINASWHVGIDSQVLFDAVDYAAQNGVLFVAAAGNEGTNNDDFPVWPASYALPNVISVMASNRHDEKPGFSNYGPLTVHLAAPGTGILSTHHYWLTPQYRGYTGTSAAAAHVAAAAAMVKALRPAMTPAAIKAHLMASVDPKPYLKCIAGGRLSLKRVVCELP